MFTRFCEFPQDLPNCNFILRGLAREDGVTAYAHREDPQGPIAGADAPDVGHKTLRTRGHVAAKLTIQPKISAEIAQTVAPNLNRFIHIETYSYN